MGDRANTFIQTDNLGNGTWAGIGIYSHWHGTRLHATVLDHLPFAKQRLGDPSYFARIIVHRVLIDIADDTSPTGFGLWTTGPDDNEHPILVVNAMTGHHWYVDEGSWAYDEPKEES